MRPRVGQRRWWAGASVLLLACGGSSVVEGPGGGGAGAGGGSGGSGGCAPAQGGSGVSCAAATSFSSAQDLAALLPTSWPRHSRISTGPLPITPDLEALAEVVVDGEQDIPLPDECQPDLCWPYVRFSLVSPISGVSVGDGSTLHVQAGARLRLRALRESQAPAEPLPLLEVHLPCDQACPADQQRCVDDTVCYEPEPYCMHCEGHDTQTCACFSFCGPLADGTSCTYFFSEDQGTGGECENGVCI